MKTLLYRGSVCLKISGWDDNAGISMGGCGVVVDAVVGDGEPEVGGGAEELGGQPGGGGRARVQGHQHGR